MAMSAIEEVKELSVGIGSDIPQVDPALDAYGYAHFAQLVAKAIVTTPSPHGLVMAIHGQWGAGKSSLLNFVKHYLQGMPVESRPVVIDFNPWWFDDRAQLASQFLAQFKAKLGLETKLIRDLGDMLADYSDSIGKAIAYSTGIPWLDKVANILRLLKRKKKDVPALKAEISKALEEGTQRYLVVIDDIDRLTPAEIREVFKVVKALADFPNVIYILSFDREVVAEALSHTTGQDGEAYLEKIVQVPFVLPAISREKLQRKLFADLDKLVDGADLALFDQAYWGNIFVEGMAPLITKPRDIVRYVNALSVTFPALRNEVNIADFLTLEFLRVQLPGLYNTIRENPQKFTGLSDKGIHSGDRREELEFHQAWANEINEGIRPGIQSMLERIFPRLDNMGRGTEFLSKWRRLRRAASPEVFQNYFAFTIDADQLSRRAIIVFIDELSDQEQTQRTILAAIEDKRADGSSKAKDYLANLLDFEDEIDSTRAANLLRVIGQIADQLILRSDETGGFFSIRSSWRILWVMQHALARIPVEERDAILISAFKEGRALTFLCAAILAIQSTHEKPVEYGPAAVLTKIKPEAVEELKQIALARIKEATAANRLIDVPELPSVLIRWRDWGDPSEPQEWADGLISDKNSLIRLLVAFLSESRSTVMGDPVGRIKHSLNLKLLAEFIDLEKAAALLGQPGEEEQTDEESRLAIRTFSQQYLLFKEGSDPDNPFNQLVGNQD